MLALSDHASESGFVSKLVGCFTADQTDEQLIESVNSAFGTQLTAEDFGKVMGNIRAVYIDTSGYTDPTTKNNLDLVQWAIEAETNTRMRLVAMKNSSGRIGSAAERQTVSALLKATDG